MTDYFLSQKYQEYLDNTEDFTECSNCKKDIYYKDCKCLGCGEIFCANCIKNDYCEGCDSD